MAQIQDAGDHDRRPDRPGTPHPGRAGARLFARLLRYLGPMLSKMRGVPVDLSQGLGGVEIAELGPAIGGLFEALTPEEFDGLACEVLSRCWISDVDADGKQVGRDLSKPPQIDLAFQGDLMLMVKTLRWALEVNFGGFFRELARSVGAAAERAFARQRLEQGAQQPSSSSSPTSSAPSGTATA
jgi:hypothetical protein